MGESGIGEATSTCPACGRGITTAYGYVAWCPSCDWNVDPSSPPVAATRRAERMAARVDAAAARELDLAAGTRDRSGRDHVTRVVMVLIATGVHLVSLLVVLAGLYLIVAARGFLGIFFGVLLITVAVLLRPRLGRVPRHAVTLTRTEAPELFELLDEIVAAASARPVQVVVLSDEFNAAYGNVGLRRRRVVWIGVPLWLTTTPAERLAVVAHEIGHQVNGDARRGMLVGTAIQSLAAWYDALRWSTLPSEGATAVDYGSWLVSWPFAKAIELTLRLELRLTYRSHRRAEYEADRRAAEIASTDAMLAALDAFLLGTPCLRALQHTSRHGGGALWEQLSTWRGEFPDVEWERLRRVDRRRGAAVDATHPPTAHRVDALRSLPSCPGVMVLAPERAARIDVEVLRRAGTIERRLREHLQTDRVIV